MCYLLPIQSLIPQMFIKSLLCARPVRILGMGHSNIQDRSFSRGATWVLQWGLQPWACRSSRLSGTSAFEGMVSGTGGMSRVSWQASGVLHLMPRILPFPSPRLPYLSEHPLPADVLLDGKGHRLPRNSLPCCLKSQHILLKTNLLC